MDVGKRLAALRGDRSQRELARDAGLDAGTISRIERGQIDPTVSTIERLAGALGLSLQAFFADAMPPAVADGTELLSLAGEQRRLLAQGGLALVEELQSLRNRIEALEQGRSRKRA